MNKHLFIISFALLCSASIQSQTTLHAESFETDGEGTRYTSNTYNECFSPGGNPDYFLRTNTNPVLPPGTCATGFGTALTNLQGSWFWAGEDIRSNVSPPPGARPPGDITTQSITITSYNNLQVSLYLATANNNGIRWEWDDSINIKASLNSGTFFTVGRFVGGAQFGGDLREDLNLDGVADGVIVSVSNFTKYTFNIPGTGTTLRIKLDFDQYGGTEESAIDLIEVKGTLVVPIELVQFDAQKVGDVVDLKWSTASERENASFAIERSDAALEFEEIGRVNAAVATGSVQPYLWTDELPAKGINYYRLRQYDTDGKSSLSPVVQVQMGRARQIVSVSPNPAKDQTTLLLQQDGESNVQITLFDLHGRIRWATQNQLANGPNKVNIPLEGLVSGVYWIRVEGDGGMEYVRVVK